MTTLPTLNAASPLNLSDDSRLVFTNDSNGEVLSRALDDVPPNFVSMDAGLTITVEIRQLGRVDDFLDLYARIVNGATILAAADAGGSFRQVVLNVTSTTDVIEGPITFNYVNTAATEADWNGATLELRQTIARSMGGDGCHLEVDHVEIDGAYTSDGRILIRDLSNDRASAQQLGPFRSSTGRVYVVGLTAILDAGANVRIHKMNVAGDAFDVAADATSGSGQLGALYARQHGDKILIIARTTSDGSARYWVFDMSTDAFTIDGETVFAAGVLTSTTFAVGVFADGSVVAINSRHSSTEEPFYNRRPSIDGGTGWGTAAAWGSSLNGHANPLVLVDSNDVAHLLARDSVGVLYHRTILDDGTLGTLQSTTITGSGTTDDQAGGWLNYFDNEIAYGQFHDSGTTDPGLIAGSPILSSSPTWETTVRSTVAVPILSSSSSQAFALNFAGNRFLLFLIPVSTTIAAHAEYDPDTGWTSTTEFVDAPARTGGETLPTGSSSNAWVDGSDDVILAAVVNPTPSDTANSYWEYFDVNLGPAASPPAGGTTFTQSIAGALTPAGALDRFPRKVTAGALTPSGTSTRSTSTSFAGTVTAAGALIRRISRQLAGVLTSSGTIAARLIYTITLTGSLAIAGAVTRATSITADGSVSPAGALTRSTARLLTGTLDPSGQLTRRARITLGGAIALAGALTAELIVGTFTLAVGGTLALSGALARRTSRADAGTLTSSGAVTRATARTLTGSVSPGGSLARRTGTALSGALTLAGDLTAELISGLFTLAVGGTLTLAGAVTRQTRTTVAGTVTLAGALTRRTSTFLSGVLTSAGTLATEVIVGLFTIALSGSLTLSGQLRRSTLHQLAGQLTPAGAVARRIERALAGTLDLVGDLTRRTILSMAGTVASSGEVTTFPRIRKGGQIAPVGTRRSVVRVALGGTLSTVGTMTKTYAIAFAGSLTMAGVVATYQFRIIAGAVGRYIRTQTGRAGRIRHQGRGAGRILGQSEKE